MSSKHIKLPPSFSSLTIAECLRTNLESRGCEIIQHAKVEDRTLGILTKIDLFMSEDGDEQEEMKQLLECQQPSSFTLPWGWLGTTSKRAGVSAVDGSTAAELGQLHATDVYENKLFDSKFPKLKSVQNLGLVNIRQRLQGLYENFIVDQWMEEINRSIEIEKATELRNYNLLGGSMEKSEVYHSYLTRLFSISIPVLTIDHIKMDISLRFKDLLVHPNPWSSLGEQELANEINQYGQLIGNPAADFSYSKPRALSETKSVLSHEADANMFSDQQMLFASLHRIFDILQMNPEETVSKLITRFNSDDISTAVTKIARFTLLQQEVKTYLLTMLQNVTAAFRDWFDNYLQDIRNTSNLMEFGYFCQGANWHCKYRWREPRMLSQHPHVMIGKLIRIITDYFQQHPFACNEDMMMKEDCENARLQILQNMLKLEEIENALKAFHRKVKGDNVLSSGDQLGFLLLLLAT